MNLTKPILDIYLFSKKLSEIVGWQGPALTLGWYFISGFLLRAITPAFGKLVAIEQRLEGEYRSQHLDLLSHSEEVAFYNGNDWEKAKLNEKYETMRRHMNSVISKRSLMGIIDSMLVKYGATMVGYTVVGLPVFGP
jgi:ATP-binding cassette subfamily D (ALD) protein 3